MLGPTWDDLEEDLDGDLVHFSLWMSRKLEHQLLGPTLGFSLTGASPDGDPGALLFVDVKEVKAACWDLPWDAPLLGRRPGW